MPKYLVIITKMVRKTYETEVEAIDSEDAKEVAWDEAHPVFTNFAWDEKTYDSDTEVREIKQ